MESLPQETRSKQCAPEVKTLARKNADIMQTFTERAVLWAAKAYLTNLKAYIYTCAPMLRLSQQVRTSLSMEVKGCFNMLSWGKENKT